jgi:hypothetical protein
MVICACTNREAESKNDKTRMDLIRIVFPPVLIWYEVVELAPGFGPYTLMNFIASALA